VTDDNPDRYLVTGALGALGAWTIRHLLDAGVSVIAHDLATSPDRLRLIIDDDDLSRVTFVTGNVADVDDMERVVVSGGVTHIIHLAALQVPFVRANPVLGATVNVVGTTAMLEVACRHMDQVRGVTYASSGGVYSPEDANPGQPLTRDTPIRPPTLYGVFKTANEGTAEIYWREYGLSSICLRPCGIVYGPGRDQGSTSPPSKAMLAAAIGCEYYIPWGGRTVFEHASDVAMAFVQAAQAQPERHFVFNLGGATGSVADVVAAIEEAEPAMAGRIAIGSDTVVGPVEVDETDLTEVMDRVRWRPIATGVAETIGTLKAAIERGALDADGIRKRLIAETQRATAAG
jgi:nucleoside-diphosphate-sugar epimerase